MIFDKAMNICNEFAFLKSMRVSKCGEDNFQNIVSISVCPKGFDFNSQKYTNGMTFSATDNSISYDVYIMITNFKPFIAIPLEELISDYQIKLTYNELKESFKNNVVKFRAIDKFIEDKIPHPDSHIITMLSPLY